MICSIVKDPVFLAQKSAVATKEDLSIAQDLLDTFRANRTGCVGMAANMIGAAKRIIVFENGGSDEVMFNPEIIKASDRYKTEEGCLSLEGVRTVLRWNSIKVRYQNEEFQTRIKTFTGWTAQIIQHEIDHCNGILV